MLIDRRLFLAGAGAMLAEGLAPRQAAALATSDALVLAPARRDDGSFAVMVFSEAGRLIREVPIPARGHDLAVHEGTGRAVIFARRPGTFAIAFDVHGRSAPELIVAEAERHFFGHGAYSADGRLLFATENDVASDQGMIGIYDATHGYARIGEFPTHGIGTHEAVLMPGGRILAIANGGIETNPVYGREMLNLPTMDPSLAFVDLSSGHLVAQHRLPAALHQLSIRHMALGPDGAVWFGTQWEGDPLETPPLVGRGSIDGGLKLAEMAQPETDALRRYIGAMAASRDGSLICASAPRGGFIAYWDAATGRYAGRTPIADCSGIAGSATRILAANGEGRMIEADPTGARERLSRPGTAFDNHLRVVG